MLTEQSITIVYFRKKAGVRCWMLNVQNDPGVISLEWLMEQISTRIEADLGALYLVDFIPNLKYMLRAQFLQEDLAEALEKFEQRVILQVDCYSYVLQKLFFRFLAYVLHTVTGNQ